MTHMSTQETLPSIALISLLTPLSFMHSPSAQSKHNGLLLQYEVSWIYGTFIWGAAWLNASKTTLEELLHTSLGLLRNSEVLRLFSSKEPLPFKCLISRYINSSEWQNVMRSDTNAAENAEQAWSKQHKHKDALRAFHTADSHSGRSDTRDAKSSTVWANNYGNSHAPTCRSLGDVSDQNCHVYVVTDCVCSRVRSGLCAQQSPIESHPTRPSPVTYSGLGCHQV